MDPELQALLALMQVSSVDEAKASISAFNSFLSDIRAATGTQKFADAQASVRECFASVREAEAATGKKGPEAIRAAVAWRNSAADCEIAAAVLQEILPQDRVAALGENPDLSKLVTAVREDRKAAIDTEAKTLIDQASEQGRMRPERRSKFENIYAKYGIEALKNSIDALPDAQAQGAPSNSPAPRPAPADDASSLNEADKSVAKAMGLTEAEVLRNKAEYAKHVGSNPNQIFAT